MSKAEWVKLFKKTFKFTGGEITNEFLMSIGYLDGAHVPSCPIFKKITLKTMKKTFLFLFLQINLITQAQLYFPRKFKYMGYYISTQLGW